MTTTRLLGLALTLQMVCACPLGAATLEGQVTHTDAQKNLTGLSVHLVAATPEGGVKQEETKTSEGGAFRFDGLEGPREYGVYVEYNDVAFPVEPVEVSGEADATASVRLEVYEPSFETSKVSVFDATTVVYQGEAGVFRVQQNVLLANAEKAVVYSGEGAGPIAKFGLLPGSEEVVANLSGRIDPVPVETTDDIASFRGPIFPGFQYLELQYQVEGGRILESELWFPEDVASFRLIVPDRRLAVSAVGLYPSARRDRGPSAEPPGFQYYRGFDIAAGTRIPFRIEPIPAPPDSSVISIVGLVVMLFGVVVFVGLPLTSTQSAAAAISGDAAGSMAGEALLASLGDLEHDFEVGKISAEDRDRLREEVRREALLELALARRGSEPSAAAAEPRESTTPSPARPAAYCSSCGQPTRTSDRFCSSCGSKL